MFVVCLVYSKNTKDDEKPWIMVLNKDRGWALPGGQLTENEDFDGLGLVPIGWQNWKKRRP